MRPYDASSVRQAVPPNRHPLGPRVAASAVEVLESEAQRLEARNAELEAPKPGASFVRPVSLLSFSLLRFPDSNFPEISIWT